MAFSRGLVTEPATGRKKARWKEILNSWPERMEKKRRELEASPPLAEFLQPMACCWPTEPDFDSRNSGRQRHPS
jgi:hypothetical protein